jgi:MtN3 and saliva related transmembrane protein
MPTGAVDVVKGTLVQFLGYLAGTLTTVAFVPQVLRTWRTRSSDDLSLGMLVVFTLGVTLWLLYGIAITSTPVILANAVTLVLALTLLVLKN